MKRTAIVLALALLAAGALAGCMDDESESKGPNGEECETKTDNDIFGDDETTTKCDSNG